MSILKITWSMRMSKKRAQDKKGSKKQRDRKRDAKKEADKSKASFHSQRKSEKGKPHKDNKGKRHHDKKKKDEEALRSKKISLVKSRGCTDVICLLIFLVAILGWIATASFAFASGDPRKLYLPTNSSGELCGDGANTNKPFSLYMNILKCLALSTPVGGCPTAQVCVSKCPMSLYDPVLALHKYSQAEVKERISSYCRHPVTNVESSVEDLVASDVCPTYLFPSSNVLGRCLPDLAKFHESQQLLLSTPEEQYFVYAQDSDATDVPPVNETLSNHTYFTEPDFEEKLQNATDMAEQILGTRDFFFKALADVELTWDLILYCILASFVLALLWIWSIR